MGDWGSPPEKRATQVQVEQRIAKTLEMLLDGHSRNDVISRLSADHGITIRTAEGYYSRAKAKASEELGETLRGLALRSARRRDRIYQRAMQEGQFGTALRAEESLFKLLGIERLPMPVEEGKGQQRQGLELVQDMLAGLDLHMMRPIEVLRILDGSVRLAPQLAKVREYSEEEIRVIRENATAQEREELKKGRVEVALAILERVRRGRAR